MGNEFKVDGDGLKKMLGATALEIAGLVAEKQVAYGDSFGRSGEIMRVLYPNGVSVEQLEDALVVVRIVDKLFRIANVKDAFGESPFRDIMGYALLGVEKNKGLSGVVV